MPVIDLVANPQLKPAKITSVGGTILWVSKINALFDLQTGFPILNNRGEPDLIFDTQKVFAGEEDFIFPNEQIQFEPTPDPGNLFTYWVVDGVPQSERRKVSWDASLSIDTNETMPSHIKAVFSPLPIDGSSAQDLRPVDHVNFNFKTGPQVKSVEILAKNGTVSWFEDLRFLFDLTTGEPRSSNQLTVPF